MAEKFIEKNPDPKNPKVKNIIKKAEELKITLQPEVPKGTFKTKGIGYKQSTNPTGKFVDYAKSYLPELVDDKIGMAGYKGNKEMLERGLKAARKTLGIITKPVLRAAAPIIPFAGPAIMAMGAADVAEAAEKGAMGLDESPVAYYLGPEAAVGLMNLKARAQKEELPDLAGETDFTSYFNGGIVAVKGVK